MSKRLTPEEIAGLWPDKCPECGSEAYIGASEVRCVAHPKVCRNGWLPDHEKFLAHLQAEVDTTLEEVNKAIDATPQPMLKFMNLDGTFDDDIDEDAPTNPGIAPMKGGLASWLPEGFDGLDAKVKLALRPFGEALVRRCVAEDAFEVILYNSQTRLAIRETFTVEFAKHMTGDTGDRDFGDWLCWYLLHTFPSELSKAWDYKQKDKL